MSYNMDDENLGVVNDGEPIAVEETTDNIPEDTTVEPQDAESVEEPEPHNRKKPGSQRAREAFLREREARLRLEEELMNLKNGVKPNVSTIEDTREPQEEDFGTFKEYAQALSRYEVKKELAAAEERRQREQHGQTANQKITEGYSKFEDFQELLDSAPVPPTQIRDLLLGPNVSFQTWHHLLQNPEKHAEINKMSIEKAAIELGKIEATLAKPTVKKQSLAPPPVKPLPSSGKQTMTSKFNSETF